MLTAMMSAQKKDRSAFLALFARNFQANEAEVCGVWRTSYKLNPGNPDMLPFCLQAMQWTARNKYHTIYDVQFGAMKPWVTSVLLAVWKTAKAGLPVPCGRRLTRRLMHRCTGVQAVGIRSTSRRRP